RDVEDHVRVRGLRAVAPLQPPVERSGAGPTVAGTSRRLTPEERGMLRTVLWQREEAVPAYVEIEYDATAWDRLSVDYQKRERLLLNPLLALMAYRLTMIAKEN